MGTPLAHIHGHWYFTQLHTTDVDGATAFYSRLFDWRIDDIDDAAAIFRTASIDGRPVAALTRLDEAEVAAGVQPHWFSYLYVADIDAAVARTVELGGTVLRPTVDARGYGRMATVQDPTGATFRLFQDAAPGVTSVKDRHGSPFWYELHSTDLDAALAFYAGLVGWEMEANQLGESRTYYVANTPDSPDPLQQGAAGLMQQLDEAAEAGAPSEWGVYFNVDDVEATAARAAELGGSILMGPHDIPEVGRLTVLADPQGGSFSAMKPLPRAT